MRRGSEVIAVVGGLGMLGRAWCELLSSKETHFYCLDLPQLDITLTDSIKRNIPEDVDLVVNCAAWTDVDGAEDNPIQAEQLNAFAVKLLAEHCRRINAAIIHYSTDYIFNGRSSVPYAVDHPHDPINLYGRTKAEGECLLLQSSCDALLIRTSWLYAPWGKNFVRTIADLCLQRSVLSVVNDQRGRPTSAEHLAAKSLQLYQKGAEGIYHVTDGGDCTWYDLAVEIAAKLVSECRIEPCGSDAFTRPANRPVYSVLDLAETERLLGPMSCWRDNVADVLSRMEPVKM